MALADFTFISFDGSWVLQREFRIPCLQRLEDEHLFVAALDANQDLPDLHRDLFRRLLDGWAPVVTSLDTRELEAVGVVADWLEPVVGAGLGVHRAAISAAAERRLLIDPLRALVGTHFRGRTAGWPGCTATSSGPRQSTSWSSRGPGAPASRPWSARC